MKVLIVFPEGYLPYSPTTLNLFYGFRNAGFNVNVIADEPKKNYSLEKIEDADVYYVPDIKLGRSIFHRIARRIKRIFEAPSATNKTALREQKFIRAISQHPADIIIAIDFFALWCVQQVGLRAHVVSLEILESDQYRQNCDFTKVNSVIIQSRDRYDYLFKEVRPPYSILPNSPLYEDFTPEYEAREETSLVYCGSAWAEFGIFNCLDFLVDFPSYKLTVKGAVPAEVDAAIKKFYSGLLAEGRLIIDDSYMTAQQLTRYLSQFRMGFVFYDFYRFQFMRRFNYYYGPAGKLYQYFNAGVPVIGNQLPGFKVVEDENSGTLIPTLSSIQIKKAIDEIEMNYIEVAKNSKNCSKHFDVGSYIEGVVESVRSNNK